MIMKYKGPGTYRLIDTLENVIYVGSAKNIDRRLNSHFKGQKGHLGKEAYNQVARVEICKCSDYAMALATEQYLINKYKPKYNKRDKSHNINSKVVTNSEIYERLEKWELYWKLKKLDKEKIILTKKQDQLAMAITYTVFILVILMFIF